MSATSQGTRRGMPSAPAGKHPPLVDLPPGIARVVLGEKVAPVSFGGSAEFTLVSLGNREVVPKAHMPHNTKKYRQWFTINGQRVEALRHTGASVTTVRCHLVSSEVSSGVYSLM